MFSSIYEFFKYAWNHEDFWWYLGGAIVVFIFLYKLVISPICYVFSLFTRPWKIITSATNNKSHYLSSHSNVLSITIKGIYQMNGPKPFKKIIECPFSEAGYYTQLMSNKSLQAQWIKTNFPGANINREFSLTVNIK